MILHRIGGTFRRAAVTALAVTSVLAAAASPTYQVVARFDAAPYSHSHGGLTRASDGRVYGSNADTSTSTTFGPGRIFRVGKGGTLSTVHAFATSCDEGCTPFGTLLSAADGWLYGVTHESSYSAGEAGTVFKVHPDGRFQVIRFLHWDDPEAVVNPCSSLVQGSDGALYGTSCGGPTGGTVFRLGMDGSDLRVLHRFVPSNTDGWQPNGVVFGADGRLYGTTFAGGTTGAGVVFAVSTSGDYELVHTFDLWHDGGSSSAPLVLGPDGKLYGTTRSGGTPQASNAWGEGVVFRLEGHDIVPLHVFIAGSAEGSRLEGGLAVDSNGDLYGTTVNGYGSYLGSLFRLRPGGTLDIVHEFGSVSADGRHAVDPPVLMPGRRLIGITPMGGIGDGGMLYAVSAPTHR